MKGCWISSEQMDVSALILENFGRRQKQMNVRLEHIREKERVEKERAEKERMEKARMEKAKAKPSAEAAKLKMEQAKARAMQEALSKQQKTLGGGFPSFSTHRNPSGSPPMQISNTPMQISNTRPGPKPQTGTSSELEITKWNKQLKLVLMQHQTDMTNLMQACLLNGMFPIPEAPLEAMRKTTLGRLQEAAEGLRSCNALSISEQQLTMLMTTSETESLQAISKTAANSPKAASNKVSTGSTSLPSGLKQSPVPAPQTNRTRPSAAAGHSAQHLQDPISTPSAQVRGVNSRSLNHQQHVPQTNRTIPSAVAAGHSAQHLQNRTSTPSAQVRGANIRSFNHQQQVSAGGPSNFAAFPTNLGRNGKFTR
jgi:hypothetical protein